MDLIEEWLDHLELTLEDLKRELMGSWTFGYVQALSRAGIRTVLLFITERVREPERAIHVPTGAVIWLVPPPKRGYSGLHALLDREWLQDTWAGRAMKQHLMPYLATPLRPILQIFREEGCAAILVQEYECPRFDVAVLLGLIHGIPVFPCFHAGDGRSGFEGILHPISMRASAGVIISADFEARRAQDFYGIPAGKLARIPNPIDREMWHPEDREAARTALGIPSDALVAVWHGALYLHVKGLDLLPDVWTQVTEERPGQDLRLVLLGGGTEISVLEQMFATRELEGVQLPHGWLHDRDHLRLWLSAADIYVFPSRNEGYPNALLEAMACGLPVVATDIAGVPDIVGRGETAGGLLIPPGDARALAEAIGRLFDEPDLRAELARRARLRVDERFSLEVIGTRMREFFYRRGMRVSGAGSAVVAA